jgi:predicted lysophospholipase L1 biosynthesis ABC-type transport system permease subunit
MEVVGKLKDWHNKEVGTRWVLKRDVVVTTDEKYPQRHTNTVCSG